ncbi:MAG TPA: NAD(P)H-binding protein [Trebonia sp.]
MRIAIAGGTGTLGRPVAAELSERGHEVRVLSRHAPEYQVDLTTGAGLAAALDGCQVVVDASSSPPRTAAAVLVAGNRRLLDEHHVCVSIVGCDRLPIGYYRVKTEQEDVVVRGPVPWTIVRATQFHELVAGFFGAAARYGVVPAPRGVLQPIAAADAARAVADVAVGEPGRGRVEVAGPEVVPIGELAATWRRATGRRALLVPLPVPGRVGRALRDGWLTAARPDGRGSVTFATWASS